MNIKYLALAIALAVSAPAYAATPTLNTTTNSSLQGPVGNFQGTSYINPNPSSLDAASQSLTTPFTIATSGLYSFWMAALSTSDTNSPSKPSSGLFYASLTNSVGTVIEEINLRVTGNTPYLASYWSDLQLAAGNYFINIEGAHIGSGNGQTAAAAGVRAGNTTVAVPGPEAGAGLGALTMGGMALWMKRRRKGETLAA